MAIGMFWQSFRVASEDSTIEAVEAQVGFPAKDLFIDQHNIYRGYDPMKSVMYSWLHGHRSSLITGIIMGKLSTHVLDIVHGKPGAGMAIELYAIHSSRRVLLKQVVTNHEGRCDAPLLEGQEMNVGQYELVFSAEDYFVMQSVKLPSPRFIDRVSISFGIAEPTQNYHVPLVVSPWSYSTYRGS